MNILWSARSYGFLIALAAGACDDEQPPGHEGEPCATPHHAQACGDGVEVCLDSGEWSACVHPCNEPGATRPCTTGDDYPGIESCDVTAVPGVHSWSTCSHEGVPCDTPNKVQECGADGVELCDYSQWTACFDACSELGATRACTITEDTTGIERCVESSGSRPFWGTCAPEVCEPGESMDCGFPPDSEFAGSTRGCLVDKYGVTNWDEEACSTPLVLAFAARDPIFTAPQSAAATFDISGANTCTTPDWPTAATPWLARDLDRSGSIDGGHELFGNGTLLPSGDHARHGFAALASVDSNLDGAITPADLAWPELLLWSDYDSDRRSTGWELLPLHAHGVAAISLDYHLAPVCDSRGNCSRERAAFTLNHNTSRAHGEVIDVYLRCE